LTLYKKEWLRNKSTIIHAGVGYVHSIQWKGNFIAWAHAQVGYLPKTKHTLTY